MKEVYVVGLGYVGLPLAIEASKNGYRVTGFDIDSRKIENLKKGISNNPDISSNTLLKLQEESSLVFVSELPKTVNPSIFIIAVPTPLDLNQNPDLSFIENACHYISQCISDNSLVINESTSFIGTLRQVIKPLIEKESAAANIYFAVAPERIDPGNLKWNLNNTPRVIGGISIEALELASNFYVKFCDNVITVSSPEVAEASKLLENSFRQVNIALINEFSKLSKAYNFSTSEVIKAASSKPFGFMPFYPSIGVGGHCIPIDPTYLIYSAKQVGQQVEIISLANETNLSRPGKVVELIKEFLVGDLKGKIIQVAGVSYKPNVPDLRESPALKLIKELEKYGAKVIWCDPVLKSFEGKKSRPLSNQIDLGLIVTPHDMIDFTIWRESNVQVLDLTANSINYGWPKFL
jgi:UDP-N-acetyl-D-glucosamine dehydrogenase